MNLAEAVIQDHRGEDLCCPRCDKTDFRDLTFRGIQVSRCEDCAGIYIDHNSLDRLRSTQSDEPPSATHFAVDFVGNGLLERLVELLFII